MFYERFDGRVRKEVGKHFTLRFDEGMHSYIPVFFPSDIPIPFKGKKNIYLSSERMQSIRYNSLQQIGHSIKRNMPYITIIHLYLTRSEASGHYRKKRTICTNYQKL